MGVMRHRARSTVDDFGEFIVAYFLRGGGARSGGEEECKNRPCLSSSPLSSAPPHLPLRIDSEDASSQALFDLLSVLGERHFARQLPIRPQQSVRSDLNVEGEFCLCGGQRR